MNAPNILSQNVPNYDGYEIVLDLLGEAGYTIAFNINNTTPQLYHSTYDPNWLKAYLSGTYMLYDPAVAWSMANIGAIRWSELKAHPDQLKVVDVMSEAKKFGLNYGCSISLSSSVGSNMKSFLMVSRTDRELSDREVDKLENLFIKMLQSFENISLLTKFEVQVLSQISIGKSIKEIAHDIEMSAETVKLRLSAARKKLNAKTTSQAVAIAHTRGLITQKGNLSW